MSLVINHNLMALSAARNLNTGFSALANSTQRLASGLRTPREADTQQPAAQRVLTGFDNTSRGGLIDTTDVNTGTVKDSLQAILDQPPVNRGQSIMTQGQTMAANLAATRQLTGDELALLKS